MCSGHTPCAAICVNTDCACCIPLSPAEANALRNVSKEKAKAIIAAIKATKLKVNTQMQGDQVRVSGAKKDDLQAVIQTLRAGDFGIDLQFINMR